MKLKTIQTNDGTLTSQSEALFYLITKQIIYLDQKKISKTTNAEIN